MQMLTLEHLVNLRNEVKEFRQETKEDLPTIKMRISAMESQLAGIHSDIAILHVRTDWVDSRPNRIEKGLELVTV